MLMTELGLMDAFMPVVGTKAASMMDRASMMLVEKRAPEMTVLRLLQNLPPRHLTDVRRGWKVCPNISSREVEGGSELVEYPGDRRFLISKKGREERRSRRTTANCYYRTTRATAPGTVQVCGYRSVQTVRRRAVVETQETGAEKAPPHPHEPHETKHTATTDGTIVRVHLAAAQGLNQRDPRVGSHRCPIIPSSSSSAARVPFQ